MTGFPDHIIIPPAPLPTYQVFVSHHYCFKVPQSQPKPNLFPLLLHISMSETLMETNFVREDRQLQQRNENYVN